MVKGKSILYLNNFSGTGMGGGEEQLVVLARAARRSGYKVYLACAPGSGFGAWLRAEGFQVIDLNYGLSGLAGTIISLRRILRQKRISIVHAHGFWPGNIGRLALRWPRRLSPGIFMITTIHCQLNSAGSISPGVGGWLGGFLRRFLDRLTNRWGDLFIAVSEDIKDQLRAEGIPSERVALIYNGINATAVRAKAAKSIDAPPGPAGPKIGVVARLEGVKGLTYLIQAMGRLAGEEPDLHLLIIGGGALEGRLKEEARLLGVSNRIWFLGYLENPLPIVTNLDIYVLPSLSEGLNITLLEAMALSRPVVATNVGGNPELVKDSQTGLLVPARDPDALAAAIKKLLRDPELAAGLGRAAARLVEERFSADSMCERSLSLYAGGGVD